MLSWINNWGPPIVTNRRRVDDASRSIFHRELQTAERKEQSWRDSAVIAGRARTGRNDGIKRAAAFPRWLPTRCGWGEDGSTVKQAVSFARVAKVPPPVVAGTKVSNYAEFCLAQLEVPCIIHSWRRSLSRCPSSVPRHFLAPSFSLSPSFSSIHVGGCIVPLLRNTQNSKTTAAQERRKSRTVHEF